MRPRNNRPRARSINPRTARAGALVVLTAAVCAPLLALGVHRDAARARDAAIAEHASVTAQARRLLNLSLAPTGGGAGGSETIPSADLVARLRAVMVEVGIPEASLRDARQAEPAPLRDANTGLARLSGSATITAVSPGDAARLLAAWRAREPAWAVRSITLRASPTRQRDEVADLFDLDLAFEAVAPLGAPVPLRGNTPGDRTLSWNDPPSPEAGR